MELVRHSYLLGFLQTTNSAATHFRQVISLASRVPVARLRRRRSLDAIAGVARLIEGGNRACGIGDPRRSYELVTG